MPAKSIIIFQQNYIRLSVDRQKKNSNSSVLKTVSLTLYGRDLRDQKLFHEKERPGEEAIIYIIFERQ